MLPPVKFSKPLKSIVACCVVIKVLHIPYQDKPFIFQTPK